MSGSQIGGFVGLVVGSFFGAPQIGYALGAAIGGYVDPTIVEGPRLGDGLQQTSQAGIPMTWGLGTFRCAGNIIWAATYNGKPLREVKKRKRSKGGSTKNVTYSYYRSYSIGICRAIENDDGTFAPITGIAQVWRNGKLVYNTLTGYTVDDARASAKFMQKVRFSLGGPSVPVSALMEAFEGVGDVPGYQGIVYMEVNEDDLTPTQGAIPIYEFVVVTGGELQPPASTLTHGQLPGFVDGAWPLAEPESEYTITGWRGSEQFTAATIDEIIAHFTPWDGANLPPNRYLGYSASTGVSTEAFGYSKYDAQPSVVNNVSVVLLYNVVDPEVHADVSFGGITCSTIPNPPVGERSKYYGDNDGGVIFKDPGFGATLIPGAYLIDYCANTPYDPVSLVYYQPLRIVVTRRRRGAGAVGVAVPDAPGYVLTPSGEAVYSPPYIAQSGTYNVLQPATIATVDGRQQYTKYEVGPIVESTDPNYANPAFWTPLYNAAVTAGQMAPGLSYGQYPQPQSVAFLPDHIALDAIAPDTVTVGSIVARICKRSGLAESDYDVSQLTDLIDGYSVSTFSDGIGMISPLMQAFFFDAAEWDDKVRFVKRGAAIAISIGPEWLVARDGDAIEETQVQEVELLQRVTVTTIDPAAGFKPNPQTAQRRSSKVQALGEQNIPLPIVCSADQTAQMAEKRIKVAWSELRRFELALPYTLPQIVPTTVIALTDRQGRVHRINVREIGDEAGIRDVKASLERQTAYTSSAVGQPLPPPANVAAGLIGPTLLEVFNMPVTRDTDDECGLLIAAAGRLSGWDGAEIEMSTDGGASWYDAAEVTESAVLGFSASALLPEAAGTLSAQTLDVYLLEAPEPVAYETLLNYSNRAILGDEIIQYQTVTDLGGNVYRLGGLVRGTYNTGAPMHNAGERFVLLDGQVFFLQLPRDLIGTVLKFRAVSNGTDPDAAPITSFTFTPCVSQTEWPVHSLTATRDGSDNVAVSWVGRARIGAETMPQHSKYFGGYRVSFSDGFTADTTEQTYTRAATPAAVTITVAPLNTITGAGPTIESITI